LFYLKEVVDLEKFIDELYTKLSVINVKLSNPEIITLLKNRTKI